MRVNLPVVSTGVLLVLKRMYCPQEHLSSCPTNGCSTVLIPVEQVVLEVSVAELLVDLMLVGVVVEEGLLARAACGSPCHKPRHVLYGQLLGVMEAANDLYTIAKKILEQGLNYL